MISFVCWKWRAPGSRREFLDVHVNVLRAMIARNYAGPHRLVCVTDDPAGLDPRIVAVPMPEQRFEHLVNPSGVSVVRGRRIVSDKDFPNCYRRLWNFSREARAVMGDRIFSIDIDVIVCGDLTPLVNRRAPFVGWCDPRFGWRKIAGGAYMLTTGSHPEVWESFNPEASPAMAAAAGNGGSDQGWMSYKLFPPADHWGSGTGLTKINWHGKRSATTPAGARLVFTAGNSPPWLPSVQAAHPWIRHHWRL